MGFNNNIKNKLYASFEHTKMRSSPKELGNAYEGRNSCYIYSHSWGKKVLPVTLGEVCLFLKSIWMKLSRTWQFVSAFWLKQHFLRFFHILFLTQFKCLITEWCWILWICSILFIRFSLWWICILLQAFAKAHAFVSLEKFLEIEFTNTRIAHF